MSTVNKSIMAYFTTSVGKKQIMALTGLALSGFLLTHLLGNFLILVGADAFNMYAHTLTSNKLIYVAEAGLALIFLTHLGLAFNLTVENKKARPQSYYTKVRTGRGATLASVSMIYTGLVILGFLVSHLMHFKFGPVYYVEMNGTQVRDIYRVVIDYFADPLQAGWYVLAMITMAFHLGHGFQSTFQSFGFNHNKYSPLIKKLGITYAILVSAGFAGLSVWGYLQSSN
ncbi:MAG: succinate dehydrogenase cytochrome b subunit [Bacteriovoracaceae bacterium]|nr:succinate dehydrogenase cytochrome b subunit [Bacteriovoracaceae bacterium]